MSSDLLRSINSQMVSNMDEQETIFQPIQNNIAVGIPIFLVDTSGSTGSKLDGTRMSYRGQGIGHRVLDYELDLVKHISRTRGYEKVHVILWSSNAHTCPDLDITEDGIIDVLREQANNNMGGTYLLSGLKKIVGSDKDTYDNLYAPHDCQTDLIIITDGEINDSGRDMAKELRAICERKVSISIVAVETGNKDYMQSGCEVGNRLYRIIQDSNLTRYVNKFSIYNNLRTEFVNFSNPIVPESYIPYKDSMFLRVDFAKFLEHVNHELRMIKENGADKSVVLKHAHEISLTVYHYIKNQNLIVQKGVIETFCKMYGRFENVYEQVRKMLITEVDNHVSGKASTFTNSKRDRTRKVEDTNLSLMSNVCKAITNDKENITAHSMIIRSDAVPHTSCIYSFSGASHELSNMTVDKNKFDNSCLRIGKYDVPMLFPIGDNKARAANQWIRTLYSRALNIAPSNPYIYYYLMCDCYALYTKAHQNTIYIPILTLYQDYLKTFFTEEVFDANRKFIEAIVYNEKIKLPYQVIKGGQLWSGITCDPLSLFYLCTMRYVVSYFADSDKKERFIDGVRAMCSKQIYMKLNNLLSEDLCDKQIDFVNEIDWKLCIHDLRAACECGTYCLYAIRTCDVVHLKEHMIGNTDIVCGGVLGSDASNKVSKCDVCENLCSIEVDPKTDHSLLAEYERHLSTCRMYKTFTNTHVDNTSVLDLGKLTGENTDANLISPDTFTPEYEAVRMNNIMIMDPVSSSKMRIFTQKDFKIHTHAKYPFLRDLNMDNVALAGGFCRSILLKQEMKDFDFFFYGLNDDEAYAKRFQSFITDLVNSVKKHYLHDKALNVKFMIMFKPMFNVFEVICFTDPTNHFNQNFDLTDFHDHQFKSLKRYGLDIQEPGDNDTQYVNHIANVDQANNKDTNTDTNTDTDSLVESADYSHDSSYSDESDESDESEDYDEFARKKVGVKKAADGSTYFEDGDAKGIRMLHRFQFISCKYQSKYDITSSFDMFCSKVVFDNDRLYFTPKSLIAYQYMINEIMLDGGSDLFKYRASKYFKYGFSLVFPPNNRNWFDEAHDNTYNYTDSNYDGNDENRGPMSFKVRRMHNNQIIISHNSNIEKMLERNDELEKKCLDSGNALYVSHLFCSFVSILRYVEINGIDYLFLDLDTYDLSNVANGKAQAEDIDYKRVTPTQLGFCSPSHASRITFRDRVLEVRLMDRFGTLYDERSWYTKFYKSMLLNDCSDYALDLDDDFIYKGENQRALEPK